MKNVLIIVSMLLFVGNLSAQQDASKRDKRESKIKAQKIAFITKALDLTPDEAQKFWPLYNEFTSKNRALKNEFKKNRVTKEISEDEAKRIINTYFDKEQQKLTLKKNYYDKFAMILPPSKVVKLHFAENRFKRKLLNRLKKNRNRKRK